MVQVGTAPGAAAELDPASSGQRRVILGAVLDELGEVGYGADDRSSGRPGRCREEHHLPALAREARLVGDVPDAQGAGRGARSGSLRERVVAVVEQVACLVAESTYSNCMPADRRGGARSEGA